MDTEVTILIAEDDEGHARLVKRNLTRSGLLNPILHFKDGQDVLDFLFCQGDGMHREPGRSYVLLLDIRMPRVNGVEVLEKIKGDKELQKMPVTMLTTSNNPSEIEQCHLLGCSCYITKPIEYENFVTTIRNLGVFLSIVRVPGIQ